MVATLILLTVQGWFGDTVNLFAIPTTPVTVEASASGLLTAILNVGPTLIIHAFNGIVILALSLTVLALSQIEVEERPDSCDSRACHGNLCDHRRGPVRPLRLYQQWCLSQMGGSFIGAYAFYFIELYYTKQS